MIETKKNLIEPHITQILQFKDGKKIYESYLVKYNNKYITVARRFRLLEDARQFKRICEEHYGKLNFYGLCKYTEKDETVYPENLLKALGITPEKYANFYTEIIPNFEANFNKATETITPRQKEILLLRFKEYLTLERVGNRLNITRERIRQIESKAIRILQNQSRINYLIKGKEKLELISQAERQELLEKVKAELTLDEAIKLVKEHFGVETDTELKMILTKRGIMGVSIDELDLSVRPYNCLKRAKITDLTMLINILENNPADIIKIKNLGINSAREIIQKVNQIANTNYSLDNVIRGMYVYGR